MRFAKMDVAEVSYMSKRSIPQKRSC